MLDRTAAGTHLGRPSPHSETLADKSGGAPNKQFPSRRKHGEFPNYANQGLIQGLHWQGQTGVVEIPYTIHTRIGWNSGSMSINFLIGVIHMHPWLLPVKTLGLPPQKPQHRTAAPDCAGDLWTWHFRRPDEMPRSRCAPQRAKGEVVDS